MGRIQNDLGHYHEALETVGKALQMGAKHYNPDNPRLAAMYSRKANSLHALDRYEEAEEMYLKSAVIYAVAHGPDSWNGAYMELYYAQMLLLMGRFEEAQQKLSHSLAVRTDLFADDHPGIAQVNLAEASQLLDDALVNLNKRFTSSHPEIAWAHVIAAKLNRKQNNLQTAAQHLENIRVVINHPVSWNPLTRALAYQEWACLDLLLDNKGQEKWLAANTLLSALNETHPLIQPYGDQSCEQQSYDPLISVE